MGTLGPSLGFQASQGHLDSWQSWVGAMGLLGSWGFSVHHSPFSLRMEGESDNLAKDRPSPLPPLNTSRRRA